MSELKNILATIKNNKYIKTVLFFIYEGMYLIFIDFFNQYLITRSFSISEYLIKTAIVFNLIWLLLYFTILYVMKPKLRKIVSCVVNIFLLVIAVINYFMNSYFHSIFSWKDLFLSGDGFSFVSSVLKFVNLKLILFALTAIDIIVLVAKTNTRQTFKFTLKRTIIVITMMVLIIVGREFFVKNKLNNISDGWNSIDVKNNSSNYYVNWIEPTKLLRICGTYEYLINDFYHSYLKSDSSINAKNYVTEYLNGNIQSSVSNNYNGIFADKNLIFIMMESMDDWMVNEEVTPTMYEMMNHGFNFINHYSPGYVTGDTANTEFVANTGMYPSINKLSPNYAYIDNDYPFSIANLFKDNGYITNSFHRSNGFIYNREKMHLSLGYNKYHNYADMEIDEKYLDLDSYIIRNGYDKIVSDDKFMSFIITYSPHSPYTYTKIECTTNLDDIKKIYPDISNEEYLCGYSAARETDNMFKLLLDKLKEDNLLEDTVIVAFSDHPNKIVIKDDENEKLNKTIFFIYSSEMDSNQVNTITSSINILPTIINLFGIKTDYLYTGYDALNTDQEYVIFKDYTYYDGENILPLNDRLLEKVEYSSDILISNYYESSAK